MVIKSTHEEQERKLQENNLTKSDVQSSLLTLRQWGEGSLSTSAMQHKLRDVLDSYFCVFQCYISVLWRISKYPLLYDENSYYFQNLLVEVFYYTILM